MAAEVYVVNGERSTFGVGKEISFGVLPTLSLYHAFQQFANKGAISAVPLTGARGSFGQKFPGTGGRAYGWSLDVDGEVDTIGQLLAFSLGLQSTPSHSIVNTTLTASALINATSISVASSLNIQQGMKLTIGTGTGIVADVQGLTVDIAAPGITVAASNAAVVSCTGTLSYLSKMTMGALPTFSAEINRLGASASLLCNDFLGSKIDGMTLALSANKGLQCKFTGVSKQMLKNVSPSAATISTKYPIMFEQQLSAPQWLSGSTVTALSVGLNDTLVSAQVQLSNNLIKNHFGLGGGNKVRSFPEQKRKVTGSVTLDLVTTLAHEAFQAAEAGGAQTPISLTIPLEGSDTIDSALGISYGLNVYVPNAFITSWDPGDKSAGAQMQTITFEAAESAAGAADDLTLYYIGTASAIY